MMHEIDGPDRRLEEQLRRGMRPGSLSPEQRRRHLDRINQQGAWEMDFVRRRSSAELSVIAAVLLLVAAVGAWQLGVFGEDNEQVAVTEPATPTTSAVGQAIPARLSTPTVSPASSCDITPFSDIAQPSGSYQQGFERWYEGSGIRVGLADLTAINPALPQSPDSWFTGTTPVIWHVDSIEVPEISARHLDNPAATFDYVMQDPPYFPAMQSVLMFSEPGCWELSATTDEGEIDILMDVQPAYGRADYAIQYEWWQRSVPHAAPSSCDVTDWVLEDRDGSLGARFWFDDDAISMSNWGGIFWAGQDNETFFLEGTGRTDIAVTGWLKDNDAVTLETGMSSEHVTASLIQNRMQRTYLSFPEPGCWTIQATTGDTTAQFNVFVYPAAGTQ